MRQAALTPASSPITGTLSVNLTQVAGVNLGAGAITVFGVAPGAVLVPAMNVSLFAGGVKIGTIPAIPADLQVGIIGGAGQGIDAGMTIGTAPINGLGVLSEYLTNAPPALSNGQTIGQQCDDAGSQFTKNLRRSQVVASKATITNSAVAVTIMPAQIAGVFADISTLIVTVTPAATVSLPFTLTLSDGTATYVWDMETGALATSPADGTLLNLAFNPPLPATTAATAWTIATNVATVTIHAVAIAVKQKAS